MTHAAELPEPRIARADRALSNGGADRVIKWLLVTSVLSALVTIAVVLALWLRPDRSDWEPIGEFPLQTVIEVDLEDERVTVAGVKCYREEITIEGSWRWQSVDPPGISIEIGSGRNEIRFDEIDVDSGAEIYTYDPELDEYCRTDTFRNPIPAEAIEHDEVNVWKITGFERPIEEADRTRRAGVPETWETEPFTVTAPPVPSGE